MPTFRYHLQKYTGRDSRHTCPQCGRAQSFSLYLDAENRPAGPQYGRCNHAKCGYLLYPSNAESSNNAPIVEKKPTPIYYTKSDVKAYRRAAMKNALCRYLAPKFHQPYFDRVLRDYCVGSIDDAIIFWQIDEKYKIHRGKVMYYNEDGHRVKLQRKDGSEYGRVKMMWQFLHRDRDNEPDMCYFGQHLASLYPNKPVAIVESEKTALVMSYFFPWFVWVATLSLNNFQSYRLNFLKDRRTPVIVFPDYDGYEKWEAKAISLKSLTPDALFFVDDFIKQYGSDKDDIADLMLKYGCNIFPDFDNQMKLYLQI